MIGSKRRRQFCQDETGSFSFVAMFFILATLTAVGVTVDYNNAMREREHMQYAANAVALAAAQDLPNRAAAVQAGLDIAELNLAQSGNADAIQAPDIVVGNFDPATGQFTPNAQPFNAVDVNVVRDTSRGNALRTTMARLAGRESYDIEVGATALATGSTPPCSSGGFFSDERIKSSSNNEYTSNFCLYGRLGVEIGSDTFFAEGVKVEMPSLRNFKQSGNNRGVDEALSENDYPNLSEAYDRIPGIVATMQAGLLTGLPDNIVMVEFREKIEESDLPLPRDTLYVVDDVADFGSDQEIRDIAVVARKEVKMGSNNVLDNVVFASMDKLLLGSNNKWADNDFCDTGKYNSYLYGGDNIEYGSNNELHGIEMFALGEIKLGSNVGAMLGVRAVSRRTIEYGSNDQFSGCPNPLLDEETVEFSTFSLIR